MALVVFDRVQETTATTGTGTITLGGAVAGYQSFAVIGNGNTTFYCITNGAQWEVGIGTYSTTGPTLSRTTVLSNSDGNTSPITLVGASNVFVTYPSEKSVNLDASGNVSPLGTIASGTWQGTTVASGYGGTGLTTFTAANNALYSTSASALAAGTLPVAAGGTGATTLTSNGVLYGTGTTAISATAVGSTGQVLVGNTGAAPSWATVSSSLVSSFSAGTTGFTPSSATTGAVTLAGTLNVANGGTGTSTAFTAGSVLFAGASGTYSQDNANLFWDDTNNRLGIGTASPATGGPLTVSSAGASNYITVNAGSVSSLIGTDSNGLVLSSLGSNNLLLQTSGTERLRIISTGEVGIGKTPNAGIQLDIDAGSNIAILSTGTGLTPLQMISTDASASGMNIQLFKDSASPANADSLTLIRSFGRSSTGVQREYSRITTLATVVTNGSEDGELRLSTIDNGAIFNSMRLLNSAEAFIPAVYNATTASAANVFVASGGQMSRSTSSIQYKTNVEDLAQPNSANIYNMRPVWYRSTCDKDNKNWSWYGLIAEEVAEIDPRLVHWGYANDQYDITYIENNGQQEKVKTLKDDAVLQPEGVQYDRLTVLLIQEMKALKAQVESLKAEVQALKTP